MKETTKRRDVACLIPYKIEGGKVLVFLQKREENRKRAPGMFGFFGGGMEPGETPEQGLLREIWEELEFKPENYSLFKIFESPVRTMNMYMLEVGADFEKQITIHEGEYGKFFSEEDFRTETKFVPWDVEVLQEFFAKIRS